MGDDKDRARLAAMTELDREMELADRAERRDEMKERRQTARVLRQQQQAAAKVRNLALIASLELKVWRFDSNAMNRQ